MIVGKQISPSRAQMRRIFTHLLIFCLLCRGIAAQPAGGKPSFVATVAPLAMILREVAGDRADVLCLLRGGSSPHTYSPRPSDAAACARALRVFMASPELEPWAVDLAPNDKLIRALDLLPEKEIIYFEHVHTHDAHEHEEHHGLVPDPHFWTDPLTVKSILPGLIKSLAAADPAGAQTYEINAQKFAGELDALAARTSNQLAPFRGQSVILFHPSFNYLLQRHGIAVAGVLEQIPGRTPTPREILALSKTVNNSGAKAIFTEPQLPRRPAEVLAETAGVKLFSLDPMGGVTLLQTYSALIDHNAHILAEALQ